MGGSLNYQNKSYKAFSIAYVTPDENAFRSEAGGEGLDVVVLNFPARHEPPDARPYANSGGTRTHLCELCAFLYDEARGIPEEGIAPGTRWEDVPETWKCPDRSASKADFTPVGG